MSEKIVAQWGEVLEKITEVASAWMILFEKPTMMSSWAYLHLGWRLPWYFVRMLWWMSSLQRPRSKKPPPETWCSRCEKHHGGEGFTPLGPMLQGAVCRKGVGSNLVFLMGALIDAALSGCYQIDRAWMLADEHGLPMRIGDIYPAKPILIKNWFKKIAP